MQPESSTPPVIADVRLPHLSASRKPGMEMANIRIDETPEARNDALSEDRPACENRTGAYWEGKTVREQSSGLRGR